MTSSICSGMFESRSRALIRSRGAPPDGLAAPPAHQLADELELVVGREHEPLGRQSNVGCTRAGNRDRRGRLHRLARRRCARRARRRVAVVDSLVHGRTQTSRPVPSCTSATCASRSTTSSTRSAGSRLPPRGPGRRARLGRGPGRRAAVNVLGTVRILEAARHHGAQVVFSSTGGAIYGESEEPAREDSPREPLSPYGPRSSRPRSTYARTTASTDTKHVALRYGNVYGPRQDPHGEAGVVAIFLGALARGEQARISATGVRPATTSTSATSHGRRFRHSAWTGASSTWARDARPRSSSCTSSAHASPGRTRRPSTRRRASASCSAASSIRSSPRASSASPRSSTDSLDLCPNITPAALRRGFRSPRTPVSRELEDGPRATWDWIRKE